MTIIKDAFYTMNLGAFFRTPGPKKSYCSKEAREVFRENKIILVPDISSVSTSEWKNILKERKSVLQIEPRTVYHSSEICDCEHYHTRILPEGSYERAFLDLSVSGLQISKGFVVQPPFCSSLVMHEKYATELMESSLTGLYFRKINMKGVNFTSSLIRKKMKDMSLYEAYPRKYYVHELYLNQILSIEFRCSRCDSIVPYYCLKCKGFVFDCPVCRKLGFSITNKNAKQIENIYFNTDLYFKRTVFHSMGEWDFTSRFCPLRGEMWSRNDFSRVTMFSNLCTGRAAKWFVERQFGSMALVPYHVDVSNCSKDQREYIESVRYSPYN